MRYRVKNIFNIYIQDRNVCEMPVIKPKFFAKLREINVIEDHSKRWIQLNSKNSRKLSQSFFNHSVFWGDKNFKENIQGENFYIGNYLLTLTRLCHFIIDDLH